MITSPDALRAATLARFVAAATPADLPEAVRAKSVRHILDTLACGLAGAASREAQACLDLTLTSEGAGPAPAWGTGQRLAARSAALVNGIACHAFELDDTGGCDHSGAVVLPAAVATLALVQRPIPGSEFVLAVALGYDVARRVLEATGGYEPHNDAGWHSTATCGTFGAAAAAARLMGFDATRIGHAMGHAASFSSGLWAFIHDGSQTKRIHAGRAAEGGLFAAMLAGAGITGPSAVFEDRWGGFLATFAGASACPEALTIGLGERWRMERVSLKPYASCRGTHSAVDALGVLLSRHALAADDVAHIDVRLSRFLLDMCGGREVETLPQAQMSLPYALAARLVYGHAGLDAYGNRCRTDEQLRAMISRVALTVDESIPPTDEPFVMLTTRDGRSLEARVTSPLGSPANPMSDAAYFDKVRGLAGLALDTAGIECIVTGVLDLWKDRDVRWLPGALAGRERPPVFD